MKKRLLIIGAGGFGREVLGWVQHATAAASPWSVRGFLDANPHALDRLQSACPIVGDPETYPPGPDDVFVCAIGDPATRLRLARQIEQRGGRFITLIHPTAVVWPDCTLGAGTILYPHTAVTTNATLGKFVALNLHASVSHDATVGDGCMLCSHADVTGNTVLGEGVFLGSHASVLPGTRVGDFAKVGAGSVVLRSVPPRTTVVGVPAKRLASVAAASDQKRRQQATQAPDPALDRVGSLRPIELDLP